MSRYPELTVRAVPAFELRAGMLMVWPGGPVKIVSVARERADVWVWTRSGCVAYRAGDLVEVGTW